jgi:outer membrane lipoprotein-sorting protein
MFTEKSSLARAALMAVLVLMPVLGTAQTPGTDLPIEEVIQRFAAKEKEFKTARENYTFKQEVKVQELSDSDRVLGEYQTRTEISFDEKGRRTERVTYAPPSTLKRIQITKEDLQTIESIQPFVLTTDDIGLYNLKYVGKEKVDEITCYTFEVSPKKMEKGQLYFEGKIWVDDQDFQIVKTYGKPVPDQKTKNGENLFPKFETYREQIDEYWFPTYTRAVDTLDFSNGRQKIREIIRYGDYKKFQTSVKLRFGGEVTDEKGGPNTPDPEKEKLAPALDPKYKDPPKTEKK